MEGVARAGAKMHRAASSAATPAIKFDFDKFIRLPRLPALNARDRPLDVAHIIPPVAESLQICRKWGNSTAPRRASPGDALNQEAVATPAHLRICADVRQYRKSGRSKGLCAKEKTARVGKPVVIEKLEFLIAVAREKSFSRAAEICGVTQPTLSAGVKQLEDSLGVLLVNRSSRYHGLTAEGERVLEWAKRIVGDARAMRQEVRTLKEGLSGQLKIAVIPTALGIVSALDHALSRKTSGRALLRPVGLVDRNTVDARQSRDRRRHHLSRQ